ncbi:MAG TPA: M48 family metallopeptidase [Bacteroidia bacterium]|nr:M48 family metallopeptidase [Bacteroidia bacterium]
MKNKFLITSALLVILMSCSTVPITKRSQLNLLPESQMVAMSLTSYREFLSQNPPEPASDPDQQLVSKVGQKISAAVVRYMAQNKMSDRVAGYKWEFNTVNNKEANAWCMPGGKIVVYTGLLPITQDEASLAFVMGHEIGHAIARHGNERMSQGLLAQTGGLALDVALQNKSAQTRALFLSAYGAGATVGAILPFSRLHESEADKLGMIFMAMAGYDPHAGVGLWQRMSKASGGGKPPEILSTHPSDQKRINDINAYMPTAMKYYKKT